MLLYVIICYILNYIKFKFECIIFICVVYYISCGFLILYYTNIYYIISYNILLYSIILNIYLSLFKKKNKYYYYCDIFNNRSTYIYYKIIPQIDIKVIYIYEHWCIFVVMQPPSEKKKTQHQPVTLFRGLGL